ncbi:hypothetical protein [Streptomyces sp. NPDC050263]|uniref:hypothetical protein n=1 Tax=Streptomyces sp. NPDC050263 TaxID=3155037 RepID=UPI0034191C06
MRRESSPHSPRPPRSPPQRRLRLSPPPSCPWVTDGWGGGTVTSRPAGINCHTSAWDPYAEDQPQPYPSGPCTATFEVGTTVAFTATPDPGSVVNDGPTPNPVTVRTGYNFTWVMFCPINGLCSAG